MTNNNQRTTLLPRHPRPHRRHSPSPWTIFVLFLVSFLLLTILFPLMLLSYHPSSKTSSEGHHGIESYMSRHRQSIKDYFEALVRQEEKEGEKMKQVKEPPRLSVIDGNNEWKNESNEIPNKPTKKSTTAAAANNNNIPTEKLGRGQNFLPLSSTPSLLGGKRGTIQCDVNVNRLAYWNDPQGRRDLEFVSPFRVQSQGYVTFEPDHGGWNNIRMSMENVIVFAVATNRVLVLPPEEPFYRLRDDKQKKTRSFADFYSLHNPRLQSRLKIITMEEFLKETGGPDGIFPIDPDQREKVQEVAKACVFRKKDDHYCGHVFDHLERVGHVPQLEGMKHCFIFDENKFQGRPISKSVADRIDKFCRDRKKRYYTTELHTPPLIHFTTGQKGTRLLNHFYAFLHFTNPLEDNYHKRFVRDYLHYNDVIYCAAGKIVSKLQEEGLKRGFPLDDEFGGGYSSLHVRRGELQYKKVKISAEQWYDNLKEIWNPKEILYIATDERNKTFFDPIKQYHDLRFLDDYWDVAGLKDIDPNYMGMIDTIVASRGRTFAGTWFSTFTAYINRLRGYYGMDMRDSWYSFLSRKKVMQEWVYPQPNYFAREFELGWVGIDGDELVTGRIREDGTFEEEKEEETK